MRKAKISITIKAGSAEKFMEHVKHIMRSADEGKRIEPSHTFTFESPTEMLSFLRKKKIQRINNSHITDLN